MQAMRLAGGIAVTVQRGSLSASSSDVSLPSSSHHPGVSGIRTTTFVATDKSAVSTTTSTTTGTAEFSSAITQAFNDGDVALVLVPNPQSQHHSSAAAARSSHDDLHKHFTAAIGIVKSVNYRERSITIEVGSSGADKTQHTKRGGEEEGDVVERIRLMSAEQTQLIVIRIGSQLAQYSTMMYSLYDAVTSKFRNVVLLPQSMAPESKRFCNAANLALQDMRRQAAASGGSLEVSSSSSFLACTSQLNEFQQAAVHTALYGYFVVKQEGCGGAQPLIRVSEEEHGRIVVIEGPPGTGKTQTIHSIVAAVLRDGPPGQRVLVCAPSNIAVDEVLIRIRRSGVAGKDGRRTMPKLLRVGMRNSVHSELLQSGESIFFEDKVEQLLKSGKDLLGNDVSRKGGEWADPFLVRQKARDQVLCDAQVVCVTLGSMRQVIQRLAQFDFVIVDEASQATEPLTLLALASGCRRCILVGDTKQLQPTVLSSAAAQGGLNRSFVARLLAHGYAAVQLRMQYRMVPPVSAFPNAEFYAGSLIDAPSVSMTPRPSSTIGLPPMIIPASLSRLPRLLFIDVDQGRMDQGSGKSLCNPQEAKVLLEQMRNLRSLLGMTAVEFGRRLGVITYYRAQQQLLRRLLAADEAGAMTVDTVDGYQGKERDIVMVSCVRAPSSRGGGGGGGGLGFVADANRMNVSLTRAKDFLIVVGHAETLRSGGGSWANFVAYASQRGDFTVFSPQVDMVERVTLGMNVFSKYTS